MCASIHFTYGGRWNHSQQTITKHLCAGNTETFVPSSAIGITGVLTTRTCLCQGRVEYFIPRAHTEISNTFFFSFLRERDGGEREREREGGKEREREREREGEREGERRRERGRGRGGKERENLDKMSVK